MNLEMRASQNWKQTERRMELAFMGLVAIVALTFYIVASGSVQSSAQDTNPVTTPTFVGKVTHIYAINDNLVSVHFLITNKSARTGTPNCSLYIADPSGSFPGYSTALTLTRLHGGKSRSGKIDMVVNSPGSRWVTFGRVSCG